MKSLASDLTWPLPAGTVLLGTGALVYFALRGPSVDLLPSSAPSAVALVLAALALGHGARLVALAFAWGVDAFWAADVFAERSGIELLDAADPRCLAPAVRQSLAAALARVASVPLPEVAATDSEATRDERAHVLEGVLAIVRARASAGSAAGALAASDTRAEGARALAAALGLSTAAVAAIAVHDLVLGRLVAHALSSFSLVATALFLSLATLAGLGAARRAARRRTTDTLLLVLFEPGAARADSPPTPRTPSALDDRRQ